MADTITRYLYFLSFRIVQLNHGSVLLMIQLQNGAKMVVEPGGVHVLGVNGYGGKSSGTVRVEW